MTAGREAWFCPACKAYHAPHVETCPKPVDAVSDKWMPHLPIPPWAPRPVEATNSCPVCGISLEGLMGYYCQQCMGTTISAAVAPA